MASGARAALGEDTVAEHCNSARGLHYTVKDLAQLDELLVQLDGDQLYPGADAEGQRGRAGTPKNPSLPYGWLDSRDLQETHRAELSLAESSVSGG